MKLHLHTVEARQGVLWARQGWLAFRRAPLPLTALLASFMVSTLMLSLAGLVGAVIAAVLAPMLTLVFMIASHQLVQNRPVNLLVWRQPFRVNPARTRAQLQLGLLFAALFLLLMLGVDTVDAEARERMAKAMQAWQEADEASRAKAQQALSEVMADPRLLQGWLLRLGALTLLAVPFWHAPALAHWGGHSALQSLFGSCLGLWHNRGAYLMHGLVWVGVMLASGALLGVIAVISPALAFLLLTPASLLLGAVFYAGLYFSFADTFRFTLPDTQA